MRHDIGIIVTYGVQSTPMPMSERLVMWERVGSVIVMYRLYRQCESRRGVRCTPYGT